MPTSPYAEATFASYPNSDTVDYNWVYYLPNLSHWFGTIYITYRRTDGGVNGGWSQEVGFGYTNGSSGYIGSFEVDAFNIALQHWTSYSSQASWYYGLLGTLSDGTNVSLVTTSSPAWNG